ncbi:enamelin [Podarcis raffonei]|uniref:enamelin n=1 Tax=Podarcis raffonei TaxID=65483 RepID=UPI002329654F|nr:enamelin [Podarcis raffonei]
MKLTLLYLCLMGTAFAMSLRKPRKAGFGSKSEEMMQFGPYGYMNSPQLAHLAASLYGYRSGFLQMFPQQPMLPQQRFLLWPQQTPVHQVARLPPRKPHQTPVARQPNIRLQPRPQLKPQLPRRPQPQPRLQPPPKQPQNTYPSQTHQQVLVHQPQRGKQQQPQAFPPQQQSPWHFPQMFGHGGFQQQPFGPYQGRMPFGQPPASNEEGTPYYGYGYLGMGGRAPYSEEMLEQDFEEAKEKETPKESPTADPATNSTVLETNSTISNQPSQAANGTASGLSSAGNGANSPGLERNLLSGNGIPTPSPTAHVSARNGATWNGIDPSSQRPPSPDVNVIQSFPSGGQQPPGYGAHVYKPQPDMGDTRHNALISRGNPSTQTENPKNSLTYGEYSNHRGNLQNTNSNPPSVNNRPNLYEQPHYLERNPSGQRERVPFPSSDPQGQWNKVPVYRDNGLNHSPSEGHSLDSQFNTAGRVEDVYNEREYTERHQPSGMHRTRAFSHQEAFSATSRTPFETEARWYEWKEKPFIHPDHEREQFQPSQNRRWNNQEDPQVFGDAPPRYNSMYSSGSFQRTGHSAYSESDLNAQQSHSFYPRGWEDREHSPTMSPANQRESPPYSPDLPSNQMQRNTYHRNVLQEREPYPRQNPWTQEKQVLDLDREYRNPPYNPTQHHAYPKYSMENPANQRSNLPYEEINRWTPEEHSPVRGAERLRQTENTPYRVNNAFGPRERNLENQAPHSPLQSGTLLQSRPQYPERDVWVPQMVGPSAPKETSHYFDTYPTDFRKNPAHAEDTEGAMHGRPPISSIDIAERRHHSDTLRYPGDYPREPRTVTSHTTDSHLCCAGDSPAPRENLLAPLQSAPHFQFASWEQKGSSTYPESNHAKHARHAPYPAGIQSNHRDISLKAGETKSQRENLDAYGEEIAGLQTGPPCSKSHLRKQNEPEANYETGLPVPRNTPCYGSSIRGDGHNVLAWIVGENQSKRESERAASMKFVPENVPPPPQGIRSAAHDGEDARKGERSALGFKRTPCFGSWLKQYLSSTGAPSGDQQHDQFYPDNPLPTRKPNIMVPPVPQPISSTDPSHDIEEAPLKFGSPGEELAEQAKERTPDCLLFPNK